MTRWEEQKELAARKVVEDPGPITRWLRKRGAKKCARLGYHILRETGGYGYCRRCGEPL